jgi:hypothetical protein
VGGCEAGDESAFCWMVQRHVDVGCRFSLRVGLSAEGVAAAGPALELRFDGGAARWTAEPHSLNASGAFAARQRLCAFSDPALDLAGPSPAVLVVANDLEYLFRLWPYFVNKILWACVCFSCRTLTLLRAGGPRASGSRSGSASSRPSSPTSKASRLPRR